MVGHSQTDCYFFLLSTKTEDCLEPYSFVHRMKRNFDDKHRTFPRIFSEYQTESDYFIPLYERKCTTLMQDEVRGPIRLITEGGTRSNQQYTGLISSLLAYCRDSTVGLFFFYNQRSSQMAVSFLVPKYR